MRVLVISDIHANLVALESVLAAAEGRYDAIWCLGDLVGYGPRPNECIQIVRDRVGVCVIGNHDWAALARPGINVDDFNPHARQAVLWTQDQLTQESRDFLEGLADEPQHPVADEPLLLTHASPREPVWEYILTPTIALQNFALFDEQLCLVGHTHKPAIYQWKLQPQSLPAGEPAQITDADDDATATDATATDATATNVLGIATVAYLQPEPGVTVNLGLSSMQRLIVNPGSVGQPRDNDARAAYGILDLERHTWRAERVAYPVELTQSQMRAANLPRRLIDRLSFGW
jgi:predicted phosphodiesterase